MAVCKIEVKMKDSSQTFSYRALVLGLTLFCSVANFVYAQDWNYRWQKAEFDQTVAFGIASSPTIKCTVVDADGRVSDAELALQLVRFDEGCTNFAQLGGKGLTQRARINSVTVFTEFEGQFLRREFVAHQKSTGEVVMYDVGGWVQELSLGSRVKVVAYNTNGEQAVNTIFSLQASKRAIDDLNEPCGSADAE